MRVIWLGAIKDNLMDSFVWNNEKKSKVEDGFTNWGIHQVKFLGHIQPICIYIKHFCYFAG